MDQVPRQHQGRDADQVRADTREQVHAVETKIRRKGEDAPRHPIKSEEVHGEESQVHPHHRPPEMDLPKALVQHPAADLGEPVVHPGPKPQHRAAKEHVMQVGDDEVGVGLLQVRRGGRVHYPGDPADGEHQDEANREEHGGGEPDRAAPHGGEEVEDLDPRGDGDQHGAHREEAFRDRPEPDRELVVAPHSPTEPCDQDSGKYHHVVAEQRLAAEGGDHIGDHAEHGNDQDVHLRVPEHPEQVLPENRVAALGGIKEHRPEEAVE